MLLTHCHTQSYHSHRHTHSHARTHPAAREDDTGRRKETSERCRINSVIRDGSSLTARILVASQINCSLQTLPPPPPPPRHFISSPLLPPHLCSLPLGFLTTFSFLFSHRFATPGSDLFLLLSFLCPPPPSLSFSLLSGREGGREE